jgi:hypothetical protein
MADLLSAFHGAIPVGALRSRVIHNRVNKLVIQKVKKTPVVEGGKSIVVENLDDSSDVPQQENIKTVEKEQPSQQEKLDDTTSKVIKVEEITKERVNGKEGSSTFTQPTKRKYRRRKSKKQ